ncbi:hypothetical protein SDC9_191828 [bioreactor metagenome]|uniref:Uncharacterized protein n=1 Tax=bioreactor metagenome TaxID=1076179 RepID=A0A645I088_9ZZZZ
MYVVFGTPESVVHHRVLEHNVVHAGTPTHIGRDVGDVAHALHASGNDYLRVSGLDHLSRECDSLQGRTANLVDGKARHIVGYAPLDRRLTSWNLSLSGGNDHSHDNLVYLLAFDTRAL